MGLFNSFWKKKTIEKPESKSGTESVPEPVFVLQPKDVALGLKAKDKTDAIIQVADFLIQNGRVSPEYKDGMLKREQEVSTYLMNGVAIPHGVGASKKYIQDSGIFFAQFPQGVVWNDNGEQVKIVCALASSSDAHMGVLTKLTMLVQDEKEVEKLIQTNDIQFVVDMFSQEREEEDSQAVEIKGISKHVVFTGENGMHARPATLLAQLASDFSDTEVMIHANNKVANAKSMPSILKLGILPQTEITVSADGAHAHDALEKIIGCIENDLNQEKAVVSDEEQKNNIYDPLELEATSQYLEGVSASPGIAVGEVFKLESDEFDLVKKASDQNTEKRIYKESRVKAVEQLELLKKEMVQEGLKPESEIVSGHILTIEDKEIIGHIEKSIESGYSAAFSVSQVYQEQATLLEQLDDPLLQARATDMKDIRVRLLRILENKSTPFRFPDHPFILVAEELTPTQTATLNKHPVLGLSTALGGKTSHMAILARALGLPATVGMGKAVLDLTEGQTVILDAQAARVITNPSERLIAKAQEMSKKHSEHQKKEEAEARLEAITEDGVRVEVLCNIANTNDAQLVSEKGGEGVGLFRTEFLFEDQIEKPSVDTQYQSLVEVAKQLPNQQIIIRVMDIGGDKPVSWLHQPKESNPFLGIRGLRLLLRNPDVFKDQLYAIYQAALWQKKQGQEVTLKIMFPMISRVSEFLKAKEVAEEVRKSLDAPELPLGIMIETPSAALVSRHLAKVVDFFSIGTNDLTQYTLAMDRVHPEMTKEADSLHPSILILIDRSVKAADKNHKQVGVCGNMAADPVMLTALIALGVRDVSVSPANVAAVKYLIRRLNVKALEPLYNEILNSGSGTEVRKICEDYFKKNLVEKL